MTTKRSRVKTVIAASFVLVVLAVSGLLVSTASAQAEHAAAQGVDPAALKWALLSAALSTGIGCIGAGFAVAYVGAAAVGAVAEKPQIAGRTLIFVGLAEGIAIYGLIIAIMILGKV